MKKKFFSKSKVCLWKNLLESVNPDGSGVASADYWFLFVLIEVRSNEWIPH